MKKRVLFATNYLANDTTSWLRAYGPMSLMRDRVEIVEPKIDIKQTASTGWWVNWPNWVGIDVCLMHRPFGPIAYAIMQNCKLHGVPLWVDHDDDLLAIPDQNPYARIHKDGEQKQASVEWSYKNADILTCSGEAMLHDLKTKYGRDDAIHITTGFDPRLARFKKPFTGNRKMGWRGSGSHKSDLEHFRPQLEHCMQDYADIEWYFWGIDPRDIFKSDIEGEFSPQRNFFDFIQNMTEANCSRHFVALEDNKFNRVKSNLSWLDATLAGSAVLAPMFPEFLLPGIYNYDGKINFIKKFREFMEIPNDDLKQMHDRSWEYIQDVLDQRKLNEKRWEILRNL